VLNGGTATGLGTLDTTISPVQAIIGVSGMVGSKTFAFAEALNKT